MRGQGDGGMGRQGEKFKLLIHNSSLLIPNYSLQPRTWEISCANVKGLKGLAFSSANRLRRNAALIPKSS